MTAASLRPGRPRRILLWLLTAGAGVHMTLWLAAAVSRPTHGFVSHYAASRLVLEGADVHRFYDDAWFMAQVARFEPDIVDLYGANQPTMSLLLLAVAPLEYRAARILWTLMSIAMVVGGVLWAARLGGLPSEWMAALLAFVFLFQPVRANLFHGAAYALMLLLLVGAWWAYRTRRDAGVGASLGLMFSAKTAGLAYWLLLLVRRRWRALAWGGGTVLLLASISVPIVGVPAWLAYAERALQLPSEPSLAVTAYQTVPGWFRHLLAHHPVWNPQPISDAPVLAAALTWLAAGAMLLASGFVARRNPSDLVFGSFAALGLMLSPVSTDTHYTMALLPIVILLSALRARMLSAEGLLLIAAALLIAGDLPYTSPRLAAGAWAFFAYPKLYGAFLLWALSLWLASRESTMLRARSRPG
jgi:hypothetical protein